MVYRTAQWGLGGGSEGEEVEMDDEKAVEWYKKSAEQGNTDAKEALKSLNNQNK